MPHNLSDTFHRRNLLGTIAAAGTVAAMQGPFGLPWAAAAETKSSGKKYPFKKSINLWAFPYPQKMSLEQCLQLAKDAGFDGIELNYDLDNDLSPKSGAKEYTAIRK